MLKVIYIIIFALLLIGTVVLVIEARYPRLDSFLSTYQVQCMDGRERGTFHSSDLNYSLDDFSVDKNGAGDFAKIACDNKDIDASSSVDIYFNHRDLIPQEENYRIVLKSPIYTSSWTELLLWLLISLVVEILILNVIRAVFFYIIDGRKFWKTLILKK